MFRKVDHERIIEGEMEKLLGELGFIESLVDLWVAMKL